jgi:hypothetical protein
MNSESITVYMPKDLKQFVQDMADNDAVSPGIWVRQLIARARRQQFDPLKRLPVPVPMAS